MLSERLLAALALPSSQSLRQRLAEALRRLVATGELAPGQRLPSSRTLASDLGLGRNTVVQAYDLLCEQGYLRSQAASGVFVVPQPPVYEVPALPGPASGGAPPRSGLSNRALAVLRQPQIAAGGPQSAFALSTPDLSHFRFDLWQTLLGQHQRGLRTADLHYAAPGGHPRLRAAIAAHVRLTRQVVCVPEQVVVVNGAQQGLDLCMRLLADEGEPVWLEDPGYPGARRAAALAGLRAVEVAVDEEGLAPRPGLPAPRLICVTPSHQFPTGALMGVARRQALLALARAHDAWVIEDDYDGEFRLSGEPVPSLQGLDGGQRVVYLGSFSKVMFPALRLGYVILPASLAERFAEAAALACLEGRLGLQSALAAFMNEGHFAAHVRRMRQVYAERRDQLAELWRAELGTAAPLVGTNTGMQVLAPLPLGVAAAVSRSAREAGIVAQTLAAFTSGPVERDGLVLGYGGVHPHELAACGRRLAGIVARHLGGA